MKVAVLFSGGKDSTYALYIMQQQHEIKYLATIHSKKPDSYMYHTANIGLTVLQAEALGLQLISKESSGEQETEDLKILLHGLDIEGVVVGAIASEYQRSRVEKVCEELGLKLISPLWKNDVEVYLRGMLRAGFEILITAVAAEGFSEAWLGRRLDEKCLEELKELNRRYGVHLAGEGGEYETAVLNGPNFKKKILIVDSERQWDEKTKSGLLNIKDVKLIEK